MTEDPPGGNPDIFLHGGGYGADHPAFPAAVLHPLADGVGLRAVPQGVPVGFLQVAHDLFALCAVAGHHIAVGVNKEGIHAHVTGQQTLLTVDIVDEAVVKVGPEPLLGAAGPEQLVDQVFKVFGNHGAVVNDVFRLYEVEAVVQGSGGKLHAHFIGDFV